MIDTFKAFVLFLNSPAFELFGSNTPAIWAEVLGAALGIAMVVCNMRQIHWAWPLAFLSSALYFVVFWGSKLYGDAALQVFFAAMAAWGWWQWLYGDLGNLGDRSKPDAFQVQVLSKQNAIKLIAVCAVLWLAIGCFLLKFTDTNVPWWDAFPTALSLVATFLLGRKYIENWPMWLLVNIVGMALFAYKGLWLTVALYGLFAMMAVLGWRAWQQKADAVKRA